MISYGTGILPFIKKCKTECPDVTQRWYIDDIRALCAFERVGAYMYTL